MAMTLRTSPEDDRLIEQLAAALGTSKHEAVLRAIRQQAERADHQGRVEASAARVTQRYGDLLRRLGE